MSRLALLLLVACAPAFSSPAPEASELHRLEQVLISAQEAKQRQELPADRYEAFLPSFRASVATAWNASPRTSPETAIYARIESRLGDGATAMAVLGPALKQDPENPELRLSQGEVFFDRHDYPAALAEAEAVLKRNPNDRRALALKHFSEGRGAGTAASASDAVPPDFSEPSIADDPRVAEAGRRATGRQNALHFVTEAMARQKINDPREALRYLTLAEASDPSLADVPMSQGIAYMSLQQPSQAYGRFALAERLWTGRHDDEAALARQAKEAAAEKMRRQSAPAPNPQTIARSSPAPDPRRTTWPLGGAAAGTLLVAGLGAGPLRKRYGEGNRVALTLALVGLGAAGGALLGYAGFALVAPALGGGTLALAGGGTLAAEGVAVGAEATALAGAAAGGAAGASTARDYAQESAPRKPSESVKPGRGQGRGPLPIPSPVPIPPGPDARPSDCAIRPGENVLARFVDSTLLAPGFLMLHEAPPLGQLPDGGHTRQKHINKDIAFLIGRLKPYSGSEFLQRLPNSRERHPRRRLCAQGDHRSLGPPSPTG